MTPQWISRGTRLLSVRVLLPAICAAAFSAPAWALTITDSASGSGTPTQVAFPPAPGSVVNGDFLIEPNPGCTGPATNCGFTGDGINDQTTWIFDFRGDPGYAEFLAAGTLASATLSLTVTVREMQINTDVLRIRGLADITAQIQDLQVGETATLQFDLLAFYTADQILSVLNADLVGGTLAKYPGELPMLYQDDATVSHVTLSLSTAGVPEPSGVALIVTGVSLLALRRRFPRTVTRLPGR